MREYKKYWWALVAVVTIAFGILGYYGVEVYREAPPVVSFADKNGKIIVEQEQIYKGQEAWQSIGGMQVGSVWGHGAYQAPDWTADWLHKELVAFMDIKANQLYGVKFDALNAEQQANIKALTKSEYRTNTLKNGVITISDERIAAAKVVRDEYNGLFGNDPKYQKLRENYAMKNNTLPDETRRQRLTNFFFWTSWAAATNRPNHDATYTNNWPHEPLINNVPTTENVMWSVASIVFLLAGIGLLVWGWSFLHKHESEPQLPDTDPISKVQLTPSQRALGKYVFLTVALFIVQILLGGLTAHYTVEGQRFFGIPLSDWFPYALVRTWHLQSASSLPACSWLRW